MMKPQKLNWVMVNLYVYLVLSVLVALVALLAGGIFAALVNSGTSSSDQDFVGMVLGFVFGVGGVVLGLGGAVLHFLAIRGLQQRKRWGWTLALVLTVFNIISYIGTIILAIPAVLGLVGLLDREVQDYASH